MHIRQDHCIQGRTKASELSGLYVTRSKALHRIPHLVPVSNTWHIKALKGKEFQRSRAAGEGFVWGLHGDLGISELLNSIIYVEKIMSLIDKIYGTCGQMTSSICHQSTSNHADGRSNT